MRSQCAASAQPVRSQCAALAILAITCAHGNLCPIPSRSYSSPGSTQQRNTDIEGHKHRYQSTKLRYRIQISKVHLSISRDSSISVYNDVEVLNFDIDVSSISYYIDIEVLGFDIENSLISYWVDIECFNLRYRRLSDLRHSISKVKLETSGILYTWFMAVCTGTYRYVPVCTYL